MDIIFQKNEGHVNYNCYCSLQARLVFLDFSVLDPSLFDRFCLVLWLTPSISSVSKVRLMFSDLLILHESNQRGSRPKGLTIF